MDFKVAEHLHIEDNCKFCDIVSRKNTETYNSPIIETTSFIVIAGMGQICDGYLNICAKRHVVNLACLGDDESFELKQLKNSVSALAFSAYKIFPWFFEHGDATEWIKGGGCISHAHMHVIPLPLTSLPRFLHKFDMIDLSHNTNYKNQLRTMAPYFFIELADGSKYATTQIGLPCQFGRQLVINEYGIKKKWDWRIYPTIDEMHVCIERYKKWRIQVSRQHCTVK